MRLVKVSCSGLVKPFFTSLALKFSTILTLSTLRGHLSLQNPQVVQRKNLSAKPCETPTNPSSSDSATAFLPLAVRDSMPRMELVAQLILQKPQRQRLQRVKSL